LVNQGGSGKNGDESHNYQSQEGVRYGDGLREEKMWEGVAKKKTRTEKREALRAKKILAYCSVEEGGPRILRGAAIAHTRERKGGNRQKKSPQYKGGG